MAPTSTSDAAQSPPHALYMRRYSAPPKTAQLPHAVAAQHTPETWPKNTKDRFEHKARDDKPFSNAALPKPSAGAQKPAAAQRTQARQFAPDHRLTLGGDKFAREIRACHAEVVHKVEHDLRTRLGWATAPAQVQISTVTRAELRERLAADWGLGRAGMFAAAGAWLVSFFISTYYSPSLDSNDINTGQKTMGRIFVVARNARGHGSRRLKNQLAQALTLAALHQHTAATFPPYSDIYSFLVDYLRNPHRHRAELHGVCAAMYALAQNVAQRQAPIKHAESRWQRVGRWALRPWMGDYLKPMAIGSKLQKAMGEAVADDPARIHRAFITGEAWAALCCKPGVLELVYNADRHPGLTRVEQVRRDAVYLAKRFNPKAHAVSFAVTSLTPEPQI